jgi:tRNA U34 5-methylaminomethyl-2-thiouridine-forming methyltransferase MnmC
MWSEQDARQGPLSWQGGIPVSRRFGEAYFSRAGGLGETRHVFLAGNRLPERFRPGFRIAETGFGTGRNFLAAWAAWEAAGTSGPLAYTAFEIAPLAAADMARALGPWPDLAPLADLLLARWTPAGGRLDLGRATLELVPGDARHTLPAWPGPADAWFLDGFSPARNPELWEPPLLAAIAARTAPGGSFATFTAAGRVRRTLVGLGFRVERRRGFGGKREMLCGRL